MHKGRRSGHGRAARIRHLHGRSGDENSAKAKFGQTVKIGNPTTKCETKGLLYESLLRAGL